MEDLGDIPVKQRKPRKVKVSEKKKNIESSSPKSVVKCRALRNWQADLNGTIYKFTAGDVYEMSNQDHIDKFTHPYVNVLEVIK